MPRSSAASAADSKMFLAEKKQAGKETDVGSLYPNVVKPDYKATIWGGFIPPISGNIDPQKKPALNLVQPNQQLP